MTGGIERKVTIPNRFDRKQIVLPTPSIKIARTLKKQHHSEQVRRTTKEVMSFTPYFIANVNYESMSHYLIFIT